MTTNSADAAASKLAVQMYTVREHTKTAKDLADSLRRIAEIGYSAVQLSAVGAMNGDTPEVDAHTARRMLDDNGLRCIATHRSWEALANDTDREIAFHQTLGCDFTAIGGIPKSYGDRGPAGYAEFVRDTAPVIARLRGPASAGAITIMRTSSPAPKAQKKRAATRRSTYSSRQAGRTFVWKSTCTGRGTRALTRPCCCHAVQAACRSST
jgi:hypothetical protein